MLYILTGANGTGKTANGIDWCRQLQVKENRPVCYNGRFDIVEEGELKSWKKIDVKDWQAEPDGTIFFFDECHNDFPNRPSGSVVPDHVKMLGEHRKRGFDFFLLTQHPGNIDSFVRRLVGAPGWHRHLKRLAGGSSLVSVLQWDAVNPNCERNGSGQSAEVTTKALPKHVYGWYRSASLHTAKVRIPKAVYVFVGAVAVVSLGAWFGLKLLTKQVQAPSSDGVAQVVSAPSTGANARQGALTVGEYIEARTARVKDFPHTAPAYDQVTTPTVAPYPAACIYAHTRKSCTCYTQQGTILQTSGEVCMQVVKNGFFVDWQQAQQVAPQQQQTMVAAPPAPSPAPVVNVQLPPAPAVQPQTWSEGLAARNAQVRSAFN